ncbi:MAG: zf-HC2 domain-containing protein [Candidatus Omnitrophota bacterium]|nr:zf-HC2 domain-containing protein [Candidatus Omnitrophota bacterium]
MICEEIKDIIPKYVKHDIQEPEITQVEEHLCVCNECRLFLSQFMDKPALAFEKQKPFTDKETTSGQIIKNTFPLEYIILGVSSIILLLFIYLLIKS